MDETLLTIDISQVHKMLPIPHDKGIGNDFLLAEFNGINGVRGETLMHILQFPVRFDGYLCVFCLKGEFTVDINLGSYAVTSNTLFINVPGNIIRFDTSRGELNPHTRLIFVAMSRQFMTSLHFDFNRMFQESVRLFDSPCIRLTDEQFNLAKDYYDLSKKIMAGDSHNKKEIIGALITSIAYIAADIWASNISHGTPTEPANQRLKMIFDRFISLVTDYHMSERNMAFYADKLCLTPKYLSKLVKQASGRSAPEWIDSFVILEAKNMLKYSDITIKEIVFRLHFPNQSVFYKFFKSHTGMTPSEYRNG